MSCRSVSGKAFTILKGMIAMRFTSYRISYYTTETPTGEFIRIRTKGQIEQIVDYGMVYWVLEGVLPSDGLHCETQFVFEGCFDDCVELYRRITGSTKDIGRPSGFMQYSLNSLPV